MFKRSLILNKNKFNCYYSKTQRRYGSSWFGATIFLLKGARINYTLVAGICGAFFSLYIIKNGLADGGLLITQKQDIINELMRHLDRGRNHPCNMIFNALYFSNEQLIDAAKITKFYGLSIDDSITLVNYATHIHQYDNIIANAVGDAKLIEVFKVTQAQLDSEEFLIGIRTILFEYKIPGSEIQFASNNMTVVDKYSNRLVQLSPVRNLK